jgi:hypothetical protein
VPLRLAALPTGIHGRGTMPSPESGVNYRFLAGFFTQTLPFSFD